jgi:pyridoxal/pyridoxine/pyridoxamine kinase
MALFVRVLNTTDWIITDEHRQQVATWLLEEEHPEIVVSSLADIMAVLRSIPHQQITSMQCELSAARETLLFKTRSDNHRPGAGDMILALLQRQYAQINT